MGSILMLILIILLIFWPILILIGIHLIHSELIKIRKEMKKLSRPEGIRYVHKGADTSRG